MSIIRVKKKGGFFAASNVPFNDERLSWEARGVMGYLLSKPDGWQVTIKDLLKRGDAKIYKLRRILKELEDNDYLKREKVKDEGGKFYWISTVYEEPASTMSRKPVHGEETIPRKPTDGESAFTIPRKPVDIVNTKLTSNLVTKVNLNTIADPKIDEFLKKVPTATRDLAEAFCYMHGRPPVKSEDKYWRKCWNEQLQIGLTGDLIIKAYKYMEQNGLTIRSPQSVNAVAERMKREGFGLVAFEVHNEDGQARVIELGNVRYVAPKSKKAVK